MRKNSNKREREISPKININADNTYERNLEYVEGNAFLGEQARIVRNCQTNNPMTDEEIERNWDEMEQQARALRNAYPGEVIYAENLPRNLQISSSGGNSQIVSQENQEGSISRISLDRIPENEQVQIAMYDDNGNQIVGKDNIRREVRRREAQWEQWRREGKLQEVQQTYTVGSKTVTVKFRGIPGQMYSQNTIQNFLPVAGISEKEVAKVTSIQTSSQITEIGNIETGSKKWKQDTSEMDIDQPETSTSKSQDKRVVKQESSPAKADFKQLLSDDKIEKSSKEQLIDLKRRVDEELKIRKQIEKDSSATTNYQISTDELKKKANQLEQKIGSFSQQNSTANDNKSPTGLIAGSIAGVSALVIGGVALVKSKLGKSEKK